MKTRTIVVLMVFITLFLVGCSIGSTESNTDNTSDSTNNSEISEGDGSAGGGTQSIELTYDSDLSGEITFWTWTTDTYDDIIKAFNKTYPNIKVNKVVLETGDLHNKLQTTLAAGEGAPDVSMVEIGNFPRYSVDNFLEDLLQPPYNAGRYQDLVPEFYWEQWKSIDGKRLLGMPSGIAPGVFFYRQDVYEQLGLPSEPEELGEYIKDPENFMTVAQTLTANGMYIMEFNDSPFIHTVDSVGYFDSELNWLRNTDLIAERLDYVKRGAQLEWAPHLSGLYSEEGKQLLKQGKLVSLPSGSWAVRAIEAAVPEQEGKWRATSMPLGINVAIGGSTWVIPSQSENKEAAWAFVEWMNVTEEAWKIFVDNNLQPAWNHITSLPWYQETTNPFLGDQKANRLYAELSDQLPIRRYTPLDGKAWPIFIEKINESIAKKI